MALLLMAAKSPAEEQALYADQNSESDRSGRTYRLETTAYRSMYFSLATLSWFIDPSLFMATAVIVLLVMKHREFHSKALKALQEC